ncbi:hypothetical protein KC336_g43 [Hortaea werneckii]|nr:hypothetical protein KC336_g43 [Hortaea werneckii]
MYSTRTHFTRKHVPNQSMTRTGRPAGDAHRVSRPWSAPPAAPTVCPARSCVKGWVGGKRGAGATGRDGAVGCRKRGRRGPLRVGGRPIASAWGVLRVRLALKVATLRGVVVHRIWEVVVARLLVQRPLLAVVIDDIDGSHVQLLGRVIPFREIPVFPVAVERYILPAEHHDSVA